MDVETLHIEQPYLQPSAQTFLSKCENCGQAIFHKILVPQATTVRVKRHRIRGVCMQKAKKEAWGMSRRLLAMLIALCMVISSMPMSVNASQPYEEGNQSYEYYAYEYDDYEYEYEYDEYEYCEYDYCECEYDVYDYCEYDYDEYEYCEYDYCECEYNEYEYCEYDYCECEHNESEYCEYDYCECERNEHDECNCDEYYGCECEYACEYCTYYEKCEKCILALLQEYLSIADLSAMPSTMVEGQHYIMWDFSTATTPGVAPYFRPSINANPLHPLQTSSIASMDDNEAHSQTSTAFIGEYALRWDVEFPFDSNSGFGMASGPIPQNADNRNPTSIGMWMRLDGVQMPTGVFRMILGVSTEPVVPATAASFRGFTPTTSSEATWSNANPGAITHGNWVWVEFPLLPTRWLNHGQAAQTSLAFTQYQQLYFPIAATTPGNVMGSFLSFRHLLGSPIGGEGAIYISGLTFLYNYDINGEPYFGFSGQHLFTSNIPAPPTVAIEWDGDDVPALIDKHYSGMEPITITITPGIHDIDWARSTIRVYYGDDLEDYIEISNQANLIEIDLYVLNDDADYMLFVEIWNVAGFRSAVHSIAFRIDTDPDIADIALLEMLIARVNFAQNRLNNATPVGTVVYAGRHTLADMATFEDAIANAQNIIDTPSLHVTPVIIAEIATINTAINLFMSQIIEPTIIGDPAGRTATRFGQRAETHTPYWHHIARGEDILLRDTLRAAWITTAWNIDFPSVSARGTTPAHVDAQRVELRGIYEYLYSLGINAVIFQISPHGCVFFHSEMAPWSFFLTGVVGYMGELVDSQGRPWDPLEYAIQLAREFNMEFHAWFNPYRVASTAAGSAIGGPVVRATMTTPEAIDRWPRNPWFLFGDEVRPGRDVYYVNPGLPEVRNWVVERILEVVLNYDIDVIHFDDYFYWAGSDTFDTFQERNTLEHNTFTNQVFPNTREGYDMWRRENTSLMVQDVSDAIRAYAPWVRFGISPAGVFSNGDGRTGTYGEPVGASRSGIGSTGGIYNNYTNSMADTRTWVIRNLVDYITPQLYWSMTDTVSPFGPIADWWARLIEDFGPGGQHVAGSPWGHTYTQLFAGLAPYRINRDDWGTNSPASDFEGTRQYLRLENFVLGNPAISGSMLFTVRDMRGIGASAMDALVTPDPNMAGSGSWRYAALVPEVPGLGAVAPRNPVNVSHSGGIVTWQDGETSTLPLIATHYFVVFGSNTYPVDIYNPANILGIVQAVNGPTFSHSALTQYVAITAVNRLHHHSIPGYEPIENVLSIGTITGNSTTLSSTQVTLTGPTVDFSSVVFGENIRDINAVLNVNGTTITVSDRLMRRGTTDNQVPIALVYTFLPEHIGVPITLTISAAGVSTTVNFILDPPPIPEIITPYDGEEIEVPGFQLPFELTAEVMATYAVTWTVVGTLPAGISYIERGRFYLDFIGAPTEVGSFDIIITATNEFGGSTTHNFTIIVPGARPPEFITEEELPSGALDLEYLLTIEVDTDYDLVWTIINGDLPPGLTFNNGVISGIPTQAGDYNFTIRVENEFGGYDEREFSIRIDLEPTPQTEPRALMMFDFEGLNNFVPFVRTPWQNTGFTETSTTHLVGRPSDNVFAGDHSLRWHITSAGNLGASLSAHERIPIPQRNGENPTGMGFWIKVDNMTASGGLNNAGVTVTAGSWPGLTVPIRIGLLNGNEYQIWPGVMSRSMDMQNVWQWVEVCFLTATPLSTALGVLDYDPSLPLAIPGPGDTNAYSFLLIRQITNPSATMDMNIFIDNITFFYDGATGADAHFGIEPPTVTYEHGAVNGVDGIILTIRDLRSGLDRSRLEVWLDGTNLVDVNDDTIWASDNHITATIFIPESDFPAGDTFTIEVVAFNNCGRASFVDIEIDMREWKILSIDVLPVASEVRQDGTRQFEAVVTTEGTPPEDVTWTVTGHAGASIDEYGLLSVAADVPIGTILTVTATSVFDITVSGSTQVTVIEIFTLIEDVHYRIMGFESASVPGVVPYFRDSVTGADSATLSAGIIDVPSGDAFHDQILYDFFGNRMYRWEIASGRDGSSGIGYASGQIPQDPQGRNPTSIGVWMRVEDVYLNNLFRMTLGVNTTPNGTDGGFRGFTPVAGSGSARPVIVPDDGWVFVEFPLYTGAWLNQGQVLQSVPAFDVNTPLFFPNSQTTGSNVAGSFLSMRHLSGSIAGEGSIYLGGIVFFYNYCEATGDPVWENWGDLLFPTEDDECLLPLPTPTNLSITDSILTWNAVTSSQGYRVYAGNILIGTVTGGQTFDLAIANLAVGIHQITVIAIGDGTTVLDSLRSSAVEFTVADAQIAALATPTNLSITNRVLTWNAVTGSQGYRVYAGNVLIGTVAAQTFNLAYANLAVGTHQITVIAIGDGTTTLDSLRSSAVSFTVAPVLPPVGGATPSLPTPVPGVTPTPTPTPSDTVDVSINDGAVNVTARVEDGNATLNITTTNATQAINTAGGNVVIDISGTDAVTSVVIPRQAWNSIANAPAARDLGLELVLYAGTVLFDRDALRSVSQRAGSQPITVAVEMPASSDLTAHQNADIGEDDIAFSVNVLAGQDAFGVLDGILTITIPFTGDAPVAVWVLDADGTRTLLPSTFNYEDGIITFETTTLATFVVGPYVVSHLLTIQFTVGSITYTVNGVTRTGHGIPFIAGNRTMLPIRTVAYALGYDVSWNHATRTASIYTSAGVISLQIDTPLPDGMGTPVMIDNRTFVPLRYVMETLGATVLWDAETRTITVIQ